MTPAQRPRENANRRRTKLRAPVEPPCHPFWYTESIALGICYKEDSNAPTWFDQNVPMSKNTAFLGFFRAASTVKFLYISGHKER